MTRHLHIKAGCSCIILYLTPYGESKVCVRYLRISTYYGIFHIAIFFRLIPNLLLRIASSPGSSRLLSFRSQILWRRLRIMRTLRFFRIDFLSTNSTVVDRVRRRGQHDVFGRRKKRFHSNHLLHPTPLRVESTSIFLILFRFWSCTK